jgi:membrane protein
MTTAPIPSMTEKSPGPAGPLEVSGRGWGEVLGRVKVKFVRDRVSMSAGSLAFHWFLALFPAVIAALGFLSLLDVTTSQVNQVVHSIDKALPPGVAGVLTGAVNAAHGRKSGSTVAIIVGLAVAIWSASAGMAVLQQALDVAYEVPVDRKYLARRIWSAPLMLALLVLGGVSAALIVFGAPIGSAVDGHLFWKGTTFVIVWTVLRWAVTIVAMSLLFSAFYFFGPNRPTPRWQWVTAGGILGTLIFLVASLGFSLYVTQFGSYGKTYGTFAGVAVLIFWLYLTGLAVLLGGEVNAELERQAAADAGHPQAQASKTRLEQQHHSQSVNASAR